MAEQNDHDLLIDLRADVRYIKAALEGLPSVEEMRTKFKIVDDLQGWKYKAIGAIGLAVFIVESLIHWSH